MMARLLPKLGRQSLKYKSMDSKNAKDNITTGTSSDTASTSKDPTTTLCTDPTVHPTTNSGRSFLSWRKKKKKNKKMIKNGDDKDIVPLSPSSVSIAASSDSIEVLNTQEHEDPVSFNAPPENETWQVEIIQDRQEIEIWPETEELILKENPSFDVDESSLPESCGAHSLRGVKYTEETVAIPHLSDLIHESTPTVMSPIVSPLQQATSVVVQQIDCSTGDVVEIQIDCAGDLQPSTVMDLRPIQQTDESQSEIGQESPLEQQFKDISSSSECLDWDSLSAKGVEIQDDHDSDIDWVDSSTNAVSIVKDTNAAQIVEKEEVKIIQSPSELLSRPNSASVQEISEMTSYFTDNRLETPQGESATKAIESVEEKEDDESVGSHAFSTDEHEDSDDHHEPHDWTPEIDTERSELVLDCLFCAQQESDSPSEDDTDDAFSFN